MKLGIVTIMDYTNYGNRLQNYAVSHVLRKKFGYIDEPLMAYVLHEGSHSQARSPEEQ